MNTIQEAISRGFVEESPPPILAQHTALPKKEKNQDVFFI